jgi:predicted negative regulator of RcsB-dependent stress response
MASPLDLEEQEQLDAVKRFWKSYGNLVVGVLIAVLASISAWNGWNWWQRDQAIKAGSMFDELERSGREGDHARAGRRVGDLKDRYGRTVFAEQAGLLNARIQLDGGQTDAAKAALEWVSTSATQSEYQTIARLRLAGMLLDAKQYDEALKQLDGAKAVGFEGLVDDRRGDVLVAQGKPEEAKASYDKAWRAMEPDLEYRRLVEAKLAALGAPVAATAASSASESASAGTSK